MKLTSAARLVMADHPDLLMYLRQRLAWEFENGIVDFKLLRSLVSSPNLAAMYVRAFSHPALCAAGETYLDARTMLADRRQRTYALSLSEWEQLAQRVEVLDEYQFTDLSIMKLQIWPFDPRVLDDFQMAIAVSLSFLPSELMADSRVSLAIDELVQDWGFYADGC